jgi:hypothetical protein
VMMKRETGERKLRLQFCVLLMVGAMDARGTWGGFVVDRCLHTVASCWILLIHSYNTEGT